jgi:signal transduction histidine kinase
MEKAHILIVDDELGPRESLRMILKDHFPLLFATNGKEAVEKVRSNSADLVIMDMKMPVMDGMEALRRMKEHNPYLPVIMVTGYGTIDTAVEAMKVGAFDYITKPFDSFALLDKVKKALEQGKTDPDSQRMLHQIQETSNRLAEQQENLQKQIVQLSKLSSIGMLAQGMAHNLSSPLLIILGRAELMKDKLLQLRSRILSLSGNQSPEARAQTMALLQEYDQNLKDTDIIIENVAKLSDIIRNVMQKSRQDQIEYHQPLNLSSILREELKFMEGDLFFKHNVEKHYDLQEDLPTIKGIYSDFSQTFLNLIQNAIDAMRDTETRKLSVSSRLNGDWIEILVRDSGCGIPQENLDRIFEPYFTTKKGPEESDKPVGTGLGLHMVKMLMEPYRVQIHVQSRPGDTSFTLRVPCGNG